MSIQFKNNLKKYTIKKLNFQNDVLELVTTQA